jgi:hypothetical protein
VGAAAGAGSGAAVLDSIAVSSLSVASDWRGCRLWQSCCTAVTAFPRLGDLGGGSIYSGVSECSRERPGDGASSNAICAVCADTFLIVGITRFVTSDSVLVAVGLGAFSLPAALSDSLG